MRLRQWLLAVWLQNGTSTFPWLIKIFDRALVSTGEMYVLFLLLVQLYQIPTLLM
jgi:hypothetical protein